MCATPIVASRWKRLFFGLEIFVVLACFYSIALNAAWRGNFPYATNLFLSLRAIFTPMLWAFLAVICFLMVASPFFLSSLRTSAFKAWLVGVVGFIYLIGIWFGWWLR